MSYFKPFRSAVCAALCLLGIGNASASLVDNGGRLIYDTDLNITWYDAANKGINWFDANSWAAGLAVGDVTGWRLPTALNADGSVWAGHVGMPCNGYNCGSEMGHLFYTELGNLRSPQDGWGLNNTGPFSNLQPTVYWAAEDYTAGCPACNPDYAFYFDFWSGYQGAYPQYATSGNSSIGVLAVHDGDVLYVPPPPVTGVPEPETYAMLLAGLGLLGFLARRRKQKAA